MGGVLLEDVNASGRVERPPPTLATFNHLPLAFEGNAGQVDESVRFVARGAGGTFYFTASDVVLAFSEPNRQPNLPGSSPFAANDLEASSKPPRAKVIRMHFRGADGSPAIRGDEALPGKANYFVGNDHTKWRANVPTYRGVIYPALYAGVDLRYEGSRSELKGTYTVAPGADASGVRWTYEGAHGLSLDPAGNLHIRLASEDNDKQIAPGELIEKAPTAWQEIGGKRVMVRARYKIDKHGTVSFALGRYDHAHTLIIDPALTYSTYLGGSSADYAYGLAIDAAGNAYVTGIAYSADFPIVGAAQPVNNGNYDVFVTKINAAGSAVVYSTFLGGTGYDSSNTIAVDSAGNAYVVGASQSPDFPTVNAIQPTGHGSADVFLTKLNATGSTMVYSTLLGGSLSDFGNAVAVNAAGEAYVAGMTTSADFPVLNAYQPNNRGLINGFITKLNAAGSALAFSTYFGGTTLDRIDDMTLDPDGNIYLVGQTGSADFPTFHPIQPMIGGPNFTDAFVTKFSPDGSALIYSTYLGGAGDDRGYRIAIDNARNAYVTGATQSPNFPIAPVPGAYQPVYGGSLFDAFVTKINAAGSALVFSTYLGGARDDYANGIAVDNAGNAYVTGASGSVNFPLVNPIQTANAGANDAFVTKFNSIGSGLIYSTFLGGSGDDGGNRIRVDGAGNAYITGFTSSPNFPTAHPMQPANGGVYDAWLAKISDAPFPSTPPLVPLPCVKIPGVHDRCERWVSTYDNPNGHGANSADAVRGSGMDPNGSRVYVIGYSGDDLTNAIDYVTIAYDTNTGSQLWISRYDGPANSYDNSSAVAVSPDGTKVFVTGWSPGITTSYDYATVAYDAATGTQLWVARYDGPGHGTDLPYAIAVSPDSAFVYVTGSSPTGDEGTEDIATIAYNATTGQMAWSARYDDPHGGSDQGISMQVSPDGRRVYVTGFGQGEGSAFDVDWKTIAYDVATPGHLGEQLWVSSYDSGTNHFDAPIALAVSADATGLFVAGQSQISAANDYEIVTLSLDPATGSQRWAGHYRGPTAGFNSGFALALSPKGDRVFATGLQSGQQNGLDSDIITLGYDAATGAKLWSSTYSLPGYLYEWAHDIAVSRDGRRVHVAGLSAQLGANGDYATLTYDAATGNQLAVDRYNSLAGADTCYGWSLTKSPNDFRIALAGVCYHAASQGGTVQDASSITTVAYDVAPVPLSAVSPKTHGSAGTFNVDLPLVGKPGIECRSSDTPGQHQIVVTFAGAVTVGAASVTSGTGKIDNYNVNGSVVTINLSEVTNAQTIAVSLSDVNDGTISGTVSVRMGVLLGDVNASGVVTSGDTNLCKAQALQPVTTANFRNDINASGSITTGDVNLIKQNALSQLPSPP
jgi:hypothetical protein